VGAGAIIFDGATIGTHSIIGIGSVVLEGRTIPPRSVAVGAPAKVMRRATDKDVRMIRESYRAYVQMAKKYSITGAFSHSIG
jgi:carbonic anhydrase/acetyltransferase-like protein (isoleucine patch superfamily)